jgi:hypothetical protein
MPSLAKSGNIKKEGVCYCSHRPGLAVLPRRPCFDVIAITGHIRQYNQEGLTLTSLLLTATVGNTAKKAPLRCHSCHWPHQAIQQEALHGRNCSHRPCQTPQSMAHPAAVPWLLVPVTCMTTRMALDHASASLSLSKLYKQDCHGAPLHCSAHFTLHKQEGLACAVTAHFQLCN